MGPEEADIMGGMCVVAFSAVAFLLGEAVRAGLWGRRDAFFLHCVTLPWNPSRA